MARKGLFIVFLISLLVGFFYLKPLLFKTEPEPNLIDRLPVGDFLGKVNIIEIARESHSFMYYNKFPFRDFLSYDFLLAQGKSYGLDLQRPAYFFANESGEWGSLISLNDSSKIRSGINRLGRDILINDTVIGDQKVYYLKNTKTYMTYGKYWMFIYNGNQLPKRMYHVIYSKKGDIHPTWKEFLKLKKFKSENLVVFSNWSKLMDKGIQTAVFAHDADSIQIHLKAYIKAKDSLYISKKDKGLAFDSKLNSNKSINLHLNLDKIKNKPNHPLFVWLRQQSKRISFPFNDFLRAWEGDLSFQEGGNHLIKETVIETVMDDEFNLTEVKKEKDVSVPGYAVIFSMNAFQKEFVSKLFAKGIMTKEANRFRFLGSPPLKINQKPNFLFLYSTDKTPKISENDLNSGFWTHNDTKYEFVLDSITSHEFLFSVHFPLMKLLLKNKFIH
jgi:hypothetical protein